jgi:uncharacterized membrane protein YdjX (TVP38/TMEM64 family)
MRQYKRILGVLGFLVVLLIVVHFSGLRDNFSIDFLQRQILANQVTGLSVFILLFSVGNLVQIPGWIFLVAAVLTMGQFVGGVVTYVAATVSCIVTFATIRLIGGDALRRLDNRLAAKIFIKLDAAPLRSMVLLRILLQTMPALNYALALSGIKFRHYLLGTLIGLPVPITLYCFFFYYVAKVLVPGTITAMGGS